MPIFPRTQRTEIKFDNPVADYTIGAVGRTGRDIGRAAKEGINAVNDYVIEPVRKYLPELEREKADLADGKRLELLNRSMTRAGFETGYENPGMQDARREEMGFKDMLAMRQAQLEREKWMNQHGPGSLKGDEKRKFDLSQLPQWTPQNKMEAFQLLGGGKDFGSTLALIKQHGAENADGTLQGKYAEAVTTNMQRLGQKFQAEAAKAKSQTERDGLLGYAKAAFGMASQIPSMAANGIAAAIENAFGTNKEAMRIAQEAVLQGAYEGLDEASAKQALFDYFPTNIYSGYRAGGQPAIAPTMSPEDLKAFEEWKQMKAQLDSEGWE